MGTFIRIVASFATVGVLLWFFARASRGRLGDLLSGSIKGTKAEPISILDRRQLTRNNAVAIIRAGSRHLLIGIGDNGVQLLAEGDDLVRDDADSHIDSTENTEVAGASIEHLDDPPLDDLPAETSRTDRRSAWTRLQRAPEPFPPRTSVIEALRTRTVRRS